MHGLQIGHPRGRRQRVCAGLVDPGMGQMGLAGSGRTDQGHGAAEPARPRLDSAHGLSVGGGDDEVLPAMADGLLKLEAELAVHACLAGDGGWGSS